MHVRGPDLNSNYIYLLYDDICVNKFYGYSISRMDEHFVL
jgi:hypothetical protein